MGVLLAKASALISAAWLGSGSGQAGAAPALINICNCPPVNKGLLPSTWGVKALIQRALLPGMTSSVSTDPRPFSSRNAPGGCLSAGAGVSVCHATASPPAALPQYFQLTAVPSV